MALRHGSTCSSRELISRAARTLARGGGCGALEQTLVMTAEGMTTCAYCREALVRWLHAQMIDGPDGTQPLFPGVAGQSLDTQRAARESAVWQRDPVFTWRAHKNKPWHIAAIALPTQARRRRAMWCYDLNRSRCPQHGDGGGGCARQSSAGPVAPGRCFFAGRGPDPVLQQIEDFVTGL